LASTSAVAGTRTTFRGTVTSHAITMRQIMLLLRPPPRLPTVPGHRAGDPGGNDVCRLRVLPGADGGT
jgi:hypothetical protein